MQIMCTKIYIYSQLRMLTIPEWYKLNHERMQFYEGTSAYI